MAEESQQQFANDAFAQAEEASKYLDTPIDLGATGAEYQYSDWMNNWYLKDSSGKDYVFVPESFVNKGNVQDIANLQGNVSQHQFYNPAFLKSETFKEASPFTYWDTKGYVWELDDAIDNGVVKGAGDPVIKSYIIDDTNRAIAGIGKPTYAPGEYQGQICYVSQPKQLSSSAAEQNFISTDGTRYIGNLKYEYVHQGSFWNTVRKVLPTINMLAPVLLDVFVAPGTGAAFGIGQSMGTAAVTGDWEKGIINAAKLYAIQEGSSTIGNIAGQQFANFGDIAKSIVQTGTTNAVTASLMGRDPIQGFISGGISGAVGAAARGIEGFGDLPVPVQKMFAAGVGSALQGKKPDQIDQAVMTAAVRSGLEAMGNAMDADKYFQEKIGRAPTTDELNNFTWYTNRNALQTSLDNYSKIAAQADATNTPLTNEQIRACLTSADPVKTAQKYIDETKAAETPAPAPTPTPTPEPTPTPTATTIADESVKTDGTTDQTGTPTTPIQNVDITTPTSNVDTSGYPVQDLQFTPENLEELQNILSTEGYKPSQWQQNNDGDYTLTSDDGSTITMHADGTVTSTASPTDTQSFLNAIKTVKAGSASKAPSKTTAASKQTGTTSAATPEITQAAKARQALAQLTADDWMGLLTSLSGDDSYTQNQGEESPEDSGAQVEVGGKSKINYLSDLGGKNYLDSLSSEKTTEDGQVEPGQDAGAGSKGAVFGPPVGTGGGGASYGPGYASSGPMKKVSYGGGPGATPAAGNRGESLSMDQILSMLKSQGGASQYGSQRDAETDRLMKSLQSAGLQDQSDAETQRLLSAQGPVAIGQVPARAQPTGVPAMPAAPAAPASTALAMEQQAKSPQADQLQQLQEYAAMMARSGKSGTSDLLDKLSNYRVFYNPMTGSYNLMDRRLNK